MEAIIMLKMCYDKPWETYADSRKECKNGNVKTFLL